MNKTIKIYGYGWVGRAMSTLFPNAHIQDPAQKLFYTEKCDVAFICVPTPLVDGKLDTSIVEQVIESCDAPLIIIRSTVMPGTCDKYPNKHLVFQPEFLGETTNHPMSDQKAREWIILGGNPEDRRKAIELYSTVYNSNVTIREVTNYEAEVIKLTENRAIAFKVMQMHELYDICKIAKLNYNTIREAVYSDDPRFNLWFTFVYEGNQGFHSSKCLKKDVEAWASWTESIGGNADITRLLVEKSKEYEKNQTNTK